MSQTRPYFSFCLNFNVSRDVHHDDSCDNTPHNSMSYNIRGMSDKPTQDSVSIPDPDMVERQPQEVAEVDTLADIWDPRVIHIRFQDTKLKEQKQDRLEFFSSASLLLKWFFDH